MQNQTEKKISDAGSISKSQITDKIKAEHSDRYDQMLMSGDITRNDVLYINYRAKYVNVSPQKMVFAMSEDVAHDFENNYTGISEDIAELDNDMIRKIRDSKALIAEKSLGDINEPEDFKKMPSLQYLSKGFMDSKEAAATETPDGEGAKKEEKGFMGSLKKAMNEPIGGSTVGDNDDDDDDDDDDDFFESIDWFDTGGESESAQYELIKKKSLKNLTFEYAGEAPVKKQPLHFVPYLTKIENCKACKGEAEVKCPTCKGNGKFKCKGYIGKGSGGPVSNAHYSCSNGKATCDECNGRGKTQDGAWCRKCDGNGKITCPTCSDAGVGPGEVPCERKYGSKYGIGKLADMASGKSYCGGKGVIPCKPCKATGRIGTLVYVKVQVGELDGEFYQYTNQKIEQIQKKPNTLYPYLKKSDVKFETVFTDTNGSLNDNYDKFSSAFIPEIENKAGVHKGNEYPRLMHEEVFYDVIPVATLEYNHILTATNHLVSAVPKDGQFDILFHSDPTAVKKFSFKNIFLIYKSKWSEAFMTQSYKAKRDKYNEIRMLIYVAKADGNIAEEEKAVLANTITGMTEYTASEKSKLFSLMSAKTLPPLTDEDFVISTRERADITFQRLHEMAMEDHILEKPEVIMVKEYKEKINANLGRYEGKFKQFVKTWQVSLTVLALIVLSIYSAINKFYIQPRKEALAQHEQNLNKEKLLLGFISWVGQDTSQHMDFSVYQSDLATSTRADNSERAEQDDERFSTAADLLKTITHAATYTIEGSNETYKDFWDKKLKVLAPRVDSLSAVLSARSARKAQQELNNSAKNQNTETQKEVLSLMEMSPGDRVVGAEVSDADGNYSFDGMDYRVEGNRIVEALSGAGADIPTDGSGEPGNGDVQAEDTPE